MIRLRSVPAAALLLIFASACTGDGGGRQFLSIGTAGTGGVYYPLGGALASRLSLADSTRQFTAEVTGGSVENVNRVLADQIDIGFALSVTAYEAFHGSRDFTEPAADLRIIAPLYANISHILVPGDSEAESLADLGGMRVSVGSAGSGTEQISRQLLELHGLTYDDIDARYLSFNESASALKDGAIDAAIFSVGIPAAAVLEATTTANVRLLSVDAEKVAELKRKHPYYVEGEIPAGAYPGVNAPIPTVAMMNWLVAREGLADDVVASVLNVLANDRVSLEQVHETAKQIDLAQLANAPIPLHAIAERWSIEGQD